MSTEKNNLELWNKVEKTNPKYTKKAKIGGHEITSISPQYQIMMVTEQFGVYGQKWGFKNINLSYDLVEKLNLVVFKGTFFFPDGEFEIINSVKLYINNALTMVDDNFAKKIETDTLTKAISKLGFNADIFMGKFDDLRYVEEMNEQFNPEIKAKKDAEIKKSIDALALTVTERINRNEIKLNACKTLEELVEVFTAFSNIEKREMEFLKNELKVTLPTIK
jgi:hypothetical protein